MNLHMYIWDGFTDIGPQLKYWADLWAERSDFAIDSQYGHSLISPRILLTEVVNEIEFNGLRNERIKKHFTDQAHQWLGRSNVLGPRLTLNFKLIAAALKTGKHSHLNELCKKTLSDLDEGLFFSSAHASLKQILLKESEPTKADYSSLEVITECLIVEFIFKGYSLKACSEIPRNIFAQYAQAGDQILVTKFPFSSTKMPGRNASDSEIQQYNQNLKNEIDSLTLSDRIDGISRLYLQSKQKMRVILPIVGVKGNTSLTVGNVEFYSPTQQRFAPQNSILTDEEMFGQDNDYVFCNAIVTIDAVDGIDAIETAADCIEGALDLLKFHHAIDQQAIILKKSHIILTEDGLSSWTLSTKRDAFWEWQDALSVDDFSQSKKDQIARLGEQFSKDFDNNYSQLIASLHWYRKALEGTKREDQLLNLWVALEKMFPDNEQSAPDKTSKIDLILDLLPYCYVSLVHYSVGWRTYYYLRNLAGSSQGGRCPLVLPKDLLERSQLNPKSSGRIELKRFVDCLAEIENILDRKIIKDKVQDARMFFSDNGYAARTFEEMISQVRTDLLLIYRYRNRIVHDAHFNDRLLPYYTKKMFRYVSTVINEMLTQNVRTTLHQACLSHKADLCLRIERLKHDSSYKLHFDIDP